jgi:hypothetical protein
VARQSCTLDLPNKTFPNKEKPDASGKGIGFIDWASKGGERMPLWSVGGTG